MDQLLWAVLAQCLSDLTAIHVSSYPLTHLSFMTLSFPCSPIFTKQHLILLQIQKQTGLSHLNPYYHRISCVNILCAASQFVVWMNVLLFNCILKEMRLIFSLLRRSVSSITCVWHSLVAMATTAITQKGLACIINAFHVNAFGSIPFQVEEKAQTLNGLLLDCSEKE